MPCEYAPSLRAVITAVWLRTQQCNGASGTPERWLKGPEVTAAVPPTHIDNGHHNSTGGLPHRHQNTSDRITQTTRIREQEENAPTHKTAVKNQDPALLLRRLQSGHEPTDVTAELADHHIQQRGSDTDGLKFIPAKAGARGAATGSMTLGMILNALNPPDRFVLVIARVAEQRAGEPGHIRRPFTLEPAFEKTEVTSNPVKLLARTQEPS